MAFVPENRLIMTQKTIYVFHKNGAESHYYALAHLCEKNNIKLKYREFSVFSKFYKGLIRGQFSLVKKQFVNAGFLLFLLFSSNKKVVLAIAPFDSKLKSLLWILKNHQLYYHSSWTCWDKSFHPKNKNNTPEVFQTWKNFLEKQTCHIFVVTQKSKKSLLQNYDIKSPKISVVYHSLHPAYKTHFSQKRIPNSFIYLGRLTTDKGIRELLSFASSHPTATLTIIGEGEEESVVRDYSERFENIYFEGFILDKEKIINHISKHQFLVLNSKKTKKWEELFGLIIIEAMSQGTLPIAPTHSGPIEIINPQFGYLFEEGEITSTLANIVKENSFSDEKSLMAVKHSKDYHAENISIHWKAILD